MISVPGAHQSSFNSASRKSTSLTLVPLLLLLLFSPFVFATEPVVDINRAGARELAEKLNGIGPAKSRAIVLYRELHGPFRKVDDLIKVKGIGPRTLEKNRALLVVNAVYAVDRFEHNHEANVAIVSGGARSREKAQKATRRAVRTVIEAARRDSITDKH